MIKKTLLTKFISAVLLISTCGAMDSEREITTLTLSVKKLEKGYNLGLKGEALELKDGTKWLVENQYPNSEVNFTSVYSQSKFYGIYDRQQKMFYFIYSVPGGPPDKKWNEELKQWEFDPTKPGPMMEQFKLTVKQIIEEKVAILKVEEKKPQQYITMGDIQVPCVWNSETQQMVLDFSSIPQMTNFLNAQFNSSPQKKPAVLQLENKVSDLKIEEIAETEKKLFLNNAQNASSFTVIKEPNNFEIKDTLIAENEIPHVSYDNKKKVWIVTERITPYVRGWLERRLGWDAYLQFHKICQQEIERDRAISMAQRSHLIEAQNTFAQAMGYRRESSSFSTLPSYVSDAELFMQKVGGYDPLHPSKEYEVFTKLYEQSSPTSSLSNADYLSAWRGFDYNLNHSDTVPTYISCLLSQSFEGKSIVELSPLSVDVQMLMTGTLSENFYNPLGIYASPIARAYNNLIGNSDYKNLSTTIHKGMAQALYEINPSIQVAIVRPIHSMSTILENSDIPFTISKGGKQNSERPYIRSLQPITHRWYEEDVKLNDEEKEWFGNSLFTLVDPKTNTFYQIDESHPFCKSPFLGGIGRENIKQFPFFTINVGDLKKI